MPVKKRSSLLALLAVATAVPAFAACIFDSGGDYQGGGHRSEVPTATETTTPVDLVPVPTTTSTPVKDSGTGTIRDAASDG